MTAAAVAGKKVIEAEPTKSPLWTPQRPIFFVNCMELLLEDGSTIYGCRFCDFTEEKVGRIRTHQTKECVHNPNPPSKAKAEVLKQAKRDRSVARAQPKPKPEPVFDSTEDILHALEMAFKPSDDDKAQLSKLEAENRSLKEDRDRVVSALNDVMDVLQKYGFVE